MGGKGKVDRSERFFLSPFFKRAREKIPGDKESPTSVGGGKGRTTFACPSSTEEKEEEEEEAQSRKLRLEVGGGGGRRQEFFTLTLKVCARGKEGRPFENFFSFSTLTTSTRPRKVTFTNQPNLLHFTTSTFFQSLVDSRTVFSGKSRSPRIWRDRSPLGRSQPSTPLASPPLALPIPILDIDLGGRKGGKDLGGGGVAIAQGRRHTQCKTEKSAPRSREREDGEEIPQGFEMRWKGITSTSQKKKKRPTPKRRRGEVILSSSSSSPVAINASASSSSSSYIGEEEQTGFLPPPDVAADSLTWKMDGKGFRVRVEDRHGLDQTAF